MRSIARTVGLFLLVAALGFAVALVVTQVPSALALSSQELPWTPDMNQESYWEQPGGMECTKYEPHSGYIPYNYDKVIVKSGSDHVTVWYDVPAGSVVNNGINPANGKPYSSPYSWVMKCTLEEIPPLTTTTTQETTTTTVPEETTTTQPEVTTTTVPEETTTTVVETTTTTEGESTTTTVVVTTPSSEPPTTMVTTSEPELPFTGVETENLVLLALGLGAAGTLLVTGLKSRED